MALDDLLTMMERRCSDTPDTLCNSLAVSAKPTPIQARTPDTRDTSQNGNDGHDGREASASDPEITSLWWRIHYLNRQPEEVSCCPPATHAEMLAWRPDAIAAEPFEPILRHPVTPLTEEDATMIRAWLTYIEETDEDIIADVLDQCRIDADAREYFIDRARETLQPAGVMRDKRILV